MQIGPCRQRKTVEWPILHPSSLATETDAGLGSKGGSILPDRRLLPAGAVSSGPTFVPCHRQQFQGSRVSRSRRPVGRKPRAMVGRNENSMSGSQNSVDLILIIRPGQNSLRVDILFSCHLRWRGLIWRAPNKLASAGTALSRIKGGGAIRWCCRKRLDRNCVGSGQIQGLVIAQI